MNKDKILSRCTYDLCVKYPFFGLFLSELNRKFTTRKEIVTACVAKAKDSINIELLVNEEFFMALNDNQRQTVLAHETLHCIYNHFFFSEFMPDKFVLNLAADCCINQELRNADEPFEAIEGWVVPEKYPELKLEKNRGTEYYYSEFTKAKKNKEDSAGRGEDDPNEPKGNGKGTSGDKDFDRDISNPMDIHITWDELTAGMSNIEKEVLKNQIRESLKEIIKSTGIGNVPKSILEQLENINSKKSVVNWKQIVRQFVSSSIAVDRINTRKRPNYRFKDAKGYKADFKSYIIFSIDSSGSISDYQLSEFFNEIHHAYKQNVKIYIHVWDTNVHQEYEYKGEKKVIRHCAGGTDASPSIEKANREKMKYDGLIILTDGYIPPPIYSHLPTLWVITEDGDSNFKHNGRKIKLNSSKNS